MKLLSVGFSSHDANMTYYDGHKVHYYKRERSTRTKHHSWDNMWEWKYIFEEVFNTKIEEVDHIAFEVTFFISQYENTENFHYFRLKEIFRPDAKNDPNELLKYLHDDTIEKFVSLFKGDINHFKCPPDLLALYQHKKDNVWIVSHHYLHSLSAWMLIDKEPDVYMSIDGHGDYSSCGKIYRNGKMIKNFHFLKSIGHRYMKLARDIGIQSNSKDYKSILPLSGKLMSFQSYGNIDYKFLDFIKDYNTEDDIEKIYDFSNWVNYKKDELIAKSTQIDFAASVHHKIGQILISIFEKYAEPHETIVYTGGVAQNVCWNTLLKQKFPNIIIPPHCGDEGLSLGGIEFLRRKFNLPKFQIDNFPYIQSDITPDSIPSKETIDSAVEILSNGYTLGWYQGNGECGPRALGNRSILFDPRIPDGSNIVNRVKNRENYRPFGASVLKEYQDEYFDLGWDDEYMLYTSKVKKHLPAVTNVDGTCRIQTVKDNNTPFRKLLEKFNEKTGCPVLLNTSLNIAGKGLCGYPEEALELFYKVPLDYIIIGDRIYAK